MIVVDPERLATHLGPYVTTKTSSRLNTRFTIFNPGPDRKMLRNCPTVDGFYVVAVRIENEGSIVTCEMPF
ncbi:hypothetical protein FHW16_002019 [Phyllobacterium myrsinacearum]|uniref:Uncharacterized protein n=1 Tax=Phyllobacterium myrsinacearum TaxID=28101 RepID=A0A839EPA9_9HYPH|nr:hypothetical protein [Phyllobacterium myrsinacearum]